MARGGDEDSLPTLPESVSADELPLRCPWCGHPKSSSAATCADRACIEAERELRRLYGGKVDRSVDNHPGRAESPEGLP